MRPLGEPFGTSWALFGVLGRALGLSWGAPGGLLESSLGPPGPSLGCLEGLLGPLGSHLEASWDSLGICAEKSAILGKGCMKFGKPWGPKFAKNSVKKAS